tara:strand:+ start:692 stop:1249 length:558 start_codon:yes stop_codon:yes gene_type:complete
MFASIVTLATGAVSLLFSKSTIVADPGKTSKTSFYDIDLELNNGEIFSLNNLKGKKIMIVNVASRCGFTSQYSKLQELYRDMNGELEIIAVPCNDFGRQEPGSAEEIKTFCDVNYNVTFPIAAKQSTKGGSPLYEWLSKPSKNGWNDKLPSWNFCKYLINENGELTHFFKSSVSPSGKEILSALK